MADPPDLRHRLAGLTQARVGLGRVHTALPTRALLDFELAHARARDAVHAALDGPVVAGAIHVRSRAADRATYLARPDLGRRIDPDDGARLAGMSGELAIVIADGLSATAVSAHAAALVEAIRAALCGWTLAPIVVAHQARVALGDEVGALLGAQAVVVLIGERPGLSAPDSLGAYLTWAPRVGRLDSERNCISNIRPPHGLGYGEAAARISGVLDAARAQQRTGVALALPRSLSKAAALAKPE